MNILEGFNFAPPAVTEVHCDHPAGVMEQEQLYLDMLRTARAYSITDEQLLIITTNGPLVFSSTPPETLPDPSVLLVDRTWFLSSINNNAVVPGSTPSAYFGSDGSLSGHTGCNLYAARFLTNLSSITITPIVSTEDPCEEPLKSQERAFINALQAATEYKVTSTSLQLIGIKGILNFTSIPVLPPRPTPTPLPPSTPTPTAEPEETEEPSPTRTSEAETETPEPTIPQAVITAPEDGFEAPVDIEILFDASDSSAETSIKEYQWDFGDDSLPLVSTKPALEYFYSEAGSYVVTLIIVDMNDVQSDPVTITITITDQ
jgi:heat shock protein HslJ